MARYDLFVCTCASRVAAVADVLEVRPVSWRDGIAEPWAAPGGPERCQVLYIPDQELAEAHLADLPSADADVDVAPLAGADGSCFGARLLMDELPGRCPGLECDRVYDPLDDYQPFLESPIGVVDLLVCKATGMPVGSGSEGGSSGSEDDDTWDPSGSDPTTSTSPPSAPGGPIPR